MSEKCREKEGSSNEYKSPEGHMKNSNSEFCEIIEEYLMVQMNNGSNEYINSRLKPRTDKGEQTKNISNLHCLIFIVSSMLTEGKIAGK